MERDVLRKVQLVQLEMMKEIDRVCRENHIRYFLYRGTFLGAVRHQGFIPWDDDMDIAMLREDYEAFCRIAPEKLNPKYCLQNWHTDPNYALPFGKIRKRNTLYTEAKSAVLQEKRTRSLRFWRMPSSSRAYPLALEKKAEHYRRMFEAEGLTDHGI